MNEALQRPERPDKLYESGLSGEADIYVVESGPNATWDFGAKVPLFHIKVSLGNPIDQEALNTQLGFYQDADPQPLRLMDNDELQARLDSYMKALETAEQERTDEFERLTGTHELPEL